MGRLDQSTKSASQSAGGASKAFQALKSIGIAALAVGAARAIGRMSGNLVRAASDAEETANKFGVTFRGINSQAEATASNLAENFGLAQDEAQSLLANTGDLLTGFGFTRESALDLSTQVQELAVDLASFTNVEGGAQQASQALTKALLGERESIKTLGIAITEADIGRLAEEKGITGELTRQQKAALTLELAIRQSGNAIGDFERSQASFANQSRIAESRVRDISVSLGQGLLPFANLAVTAFNDLTSGVADAAGRFREFVTSSRFVSILSTVISNAVGIFRVWGELIREFVQERLANLRDIFRTIIDQFSDLVPDVQDTGFAFDILSGVIEGGNIAWGIFVGIIKTTITAMADAIEIAQNTAIAIGSLGQVLTGEATFADVKANFQAVGDSIRDFGVNAATNVRDVVRDTVDAVQGFGDNVEERSDRLRDIFDQTVRDTAQRTETALLNVGDAASAAARGEDELNTAGETAIETQNALAEAAERRATAEQTRLEAMEKALDVLAEGARREREAMGLDIADGDDENNPFGDPESAGRRLDETLSLLEQRRQAEREHWAELRAIRNQEGERITAQIAERREYEAEEQRRYLQQRLDNLREAAAEELRIERETAEARADIVDQLSDTFSAFLEFRQTLIDAEIASLEAQGASEEEIAERKAELAREQAKREKALGIFNAIVNTASGVAKALSSAPPPYNFVLAALVAAAGAAQIGTIVAQPLPAAQTGGSFIVPPGNNADGGLLRVNSGERVDVTPNAGRESLIPDTIVVQIGDAQFDARVARAFNKGSAQIRRPGAVRAR